MTFTNPVVKYVLSALLGALMCLAYAPYEQWWLPFIVLPLFISLFDKNNVKQSTWVGFSFGLGWFGIGISWVHVAMAEFGGLPLLASIGLMLILVAYLSIYPALAIHLLTRFFKYKTAWWYALPVLWFLTEWVRSWMLTGFPWLSLGYSQTSGPFKWLAPVVGEQGITFIMLMFSVLLLHSFRKRYKLLLTTSVVLLAVLFVSFKSEHGTTTQPSKDIALVQGNIK